MAVKRKSRGSRKSRRSSRSRTQPTRLDLLLDRVKPGEHEVTIDADGYTPEQVDRIYAAAKARGLHASGTRRWILIRDLRTGASRHGDTRRRESDFEVVATDGRQLYFGTSSSAALAAFEDHIGSGAMMLKNGRIVNERGPRRSRNW